MEISKNNILVKTTLKNNFSLMKPFYKFYTDIWNPRHILFIVGYSTDKMSEGECINTINQELFGNSNNNFIKLKSDLGKNPINDPLVRHCKLLYNEDDVYVFLYETEAHYAAGIWDPLKYKIIKYIHTDNTFNKYEFYIGTDYDDFFYVKNTDEYLKNLKKKPGLKKSFFHAVEFIPHIPKFSTESTADFEFISSTYFFRKKAVLYDKLDQTVSHDLCREICFRIPTKNEFHHRLNPKIDKPNEKCIEFDNSCIRFTKSPTTEVITMNKADIESVCFCFSCLDLEYLLNEKYWLQSSRTETEKNTYSQKEIIDHFNKYYTLTDQEKRDNIIIKCEFMKKYFI